MVISRKIAGIWLAIAALALSAIVAGAPVQGKPISRKGLLDAIRLNGLTTDELVQRIRDRGVNFQLDEDGEREFRDAGARPELIDAIRSNYRAETAAPPPRQPNEPGGKSYNVPAGPPLSRNEVVTLLQSGVPSTRVEQIVEVRGVDFNLDRETTQRIKAAGGTNALIGAIAEKAAGSSSEAASSRVPAANYSPGYDELIDQATSALDAQNWAYAMNLLGQSIRIDASKPTAYALLEYAELYGNRNVNLASQSARLAMDRGGSAVFRVYHDHDGVFTNYCVGSFFVSKKEVTFKADNGQHTFEAEKRVLKEAKLNGFVGIKYAAFHVKVLEPGGKAKTYNFAPATQSKDEANLIVSLITSN